MPYNKFVLKYNSTAICGNVVMTLGVIVGPEVFQYMKDYMYIHLSRHLYIHLFIYPSIYISIYLYILVHL